MKDCRIAFVGAGAVAHYHAYALAALPFYYHDCPSVECLAVTSASTTARETFAARYSFQYALATEDLWERSDIDAVYILGPNALHYSHLTKALAMQNVKRVYVEKPLCTTEEEERAITRRFLPTANGVTVQLGFQFLQMSSVMRARSLWEQGTLGAPVHFRARYLHGGYLDHKYRTQRGERLKPIPEGGAAVDLGSHAFSLLAAFLGDGLEAIEALQSRGFQDIPPECDLCTLVLCRDGTSGAVGTVTASRISAGAGEVLELEIRGTEGGFRLSTESPDILEIFAASSRESRIVNCSSDFGPYSQFPKRGCASGWLRSFVHANYLFLTHSGGSLAPDLRHGLVVQRLLRETAHRIGSGGRYV